jgi:hypothetical protein
MHANGDARDISSRLRVLHIVSYTLHKFACKLSGSTGVLYTILYIIIGWLVVSAS